MAVVISAIYLAVQISDDNQLLRSQAQYNAIDLTQRPFELMVATSELARMVFECDDQPFAVAESDRQRCRNDYLMQVDGWEYVQYQNRDGAVPVELWRGFEGYFAHQVDTKTGYARFCQETAIGYAEPFRSYAAEHVKSHRAAPAVVTGALALCRTRPGWSLGAGRRASAPRQAETSHS